MLIGEVRLLVDTSCGSCPNQIRKGREALFWKGKEQPSRTRRTQNLLVTENLFVVNKECNESSRQRLPAAEAPFQITR